MNINEYININFESQNLTSTSSNNNNNNTNSSISSSSSTSLNSSSSNDDSIILNDSTNYITSATTCSTLSFTNRHDYYELEILKNNFNNLKLNIILNEIKNEMNSLLDKLKNDLTIDLQTKMTELVYEQTILNAKLAALQCFINNKEMVSNL
jgi:hypothetical protein